jgi:4-amino-4-deoxy-L-arabinose transferase-like glycosyltransferase
MRNNNMKKIGQLALRFLPIILILAIGAYLRLYKINQYMTFLGDEGRDVLTVKRMIVDGKWTLLGPTASVGGFFMGPIYYYFMLPFLWVWRLNPVGPAIMVAIFGVATIFLVFFVGKQMFSKRVGIIASFIYALSPLVIAYSRSSWNPNIVPFFAISLVFLLWRAARFNRWNELFWVGIAAGIGIQLHYTFLFLFGVVLVWVLLFGRSWKHITSYALGILGFLIGFAPFLAFEIRHGFTNSRAIIEFIFTGKDTGFQQSHFFQSIGDVYFRLFGRLILHIPDTGVLGNITPHIRDPWIAATWVLALSSGIILIAKVINVRKKKDKQEMISFTLLLIWLMVPLILFGIYKKNIYDYYFGLFFPLPFFLTAIAADQLMKLKKIGTVFGIIFIASVAFLNWQGRPFLYQPNDQLGQVQLIDRAVLSHTGGKPFNFALITGGNSDHAYRYFFEIWSRAPITIENSGVDPKRVTVTDQLMIVCEDIFCQPLGNSLWEVAGFGRGEIAGVWNVSVVKIYRLVHYQGK